MGSAELSRYLHNGQRTSEGIVIASRESGVAIRTPCRHKAARCFAPQENGFPRLLRSLGMTRDGKPVPYFPLSTFIFQLSIVHCPLSII